MPELTPHQKQGAAVAGLQIASAVALFITLGFEGEQDPKEVRESFLRICRELYDETAAEAGWGS